IGDYENLPPDKPLFTAEFQGGSFDPWGGAGTLNLYKLTGPDFENVFYKSLISQGFTMMNFYMTYGGTNWGWLPEPTVYTSYEYGAAINEQRQLTGKYTEQKLIASFTQAVPQLAATQPIRTDAPSNSRLILGGRANPDDYTQVLMVRHADATSASTEKTHIAVDLNPQFGSESVSGAQANSTGQGWVYPNVPQKPNTAITVNGRDAKLLLANYRFGSQRLIYSTSQLMTNGTSGAEDFAVLYDNQGNDGETVLRYASQPEVNVVEGDVTSTFDAKVGDLRLNYTHNGLASVVIKNGQSVLYLFLADAATAGEFWKTGPQNDPILLRGPYLVRSASRSGSVVTAFGDTDKPTAPKVYFPSVAKQLVWKGVIGAAPSVDLPALNQWKFQFETPERDPAFDDSGWTVANQTSTNNPNPPGSLPVLYEDQYGFHHGSVWYRGHFTATGKETGITLDAEGGSPGIYSVWLNGAFLGTFPSGTTDLPFPAALLKPGEGNTLAVLVMNMGHNEDWVPAFQSWKSPRGIRTAILQGAKPAITWRIQGARGGEHLVDPVRGPMNMGGLFGERQGWFLPGFPDGSWSNVSTPDRWEARKLVAGIGWYRTKFQLKFPEPSDIPINLRITDDPTRHYRALLFLNGWMMGIYANDVGPQHDFSLPTGILNPNGDNELAIAVWGEDDLSGGLGDVSLVAAGAYWGGVPVRQVASPGWSGSWGSPTVPESLVVGAVADQEVAVTGKTVQVASYLTNLSTVPAQQVAIRFSAPPGWDPGPNPTLTIPTLNPNQSVALNWSVQVPDMVSPGLQPLAVKATYVSGTGSQSTGGVATVLGPYPSLAPLYNNAGVTSNGNTNPSVGFIGFTGDATSYSAEGLSVVGITPGATIKSGGAEFTWPDVRPGSPDNVLSNGQVVALSGKGKRISFLGASSSTAITATGSVVYTDGTSTPFTVSVGNFQSAPGQKGNPANTQVAAVTSNSLNGPTKNTVYLFSFSAPIDPTKKVYAVVLPKGPASVEAGTQALHVFSLAID
ncbi:MAG TPA: beta galactosidase jelly roll domain-containing protein, partial [Chthoniobacterales bacterium]